MATWNGAALRTTSVAIGQLAHPDPKPLLVSWCRIIPQDNSRGLLNGEDKDGHKMPGVTYRPAKGTTKKARKWTGKQQQALSARTAHAGEFSETAYNNLTSAQYRRLSGPPLLPRGRNSRLITNLYVSYRKTASNMWVAAAAWPGIVNAKGKAFMHYHFDGTAKLPKRDPCGVRPWGLERAVRALDDWTYAVINKFHRSA